MVLETKGLRSSKPQTEERVKAGYVAQWSGRGRDEVPDLVAERGVLVTDGPLDAFQQQTIQLLKCVFI